MLIIADGHVHLHNCFALGTVLDAAASHFRTAAGDTPFQGVLFLTDMAGTNAYARLQAMADSHKSCAAPGDAWHVSRLPDPTTLRASREDGIALSLIAGSQVVSEERLEVLALGATERFPDGQPLTVTIDTIRQAGGLIVLPWGFGKWTGRRKSTILQYLNDQAAEGVYLGDIRARPGFLSEPEAFAVGRARGMQTLQGTDPLPFASEAGRIGSFGFGCNGIFDPERPWPSLKTIMTDTQFSPTSFGPKQRSLEFISNQLRLRLRKYIPVAA